MLELRISILLLLRSLLFDIRGTGYAAARILLPLLVGAGKQPLTWYLAIVAALLYLNFAPVSGKWSDKATGRSLLAMLALYPVGELLAKVVSKEVQSISIKSHLSWLAEMDEMVHEFNVIRSINAHEIRQISGEQTLAEMQMRMADSQDKMVEAMGSMAANLPAGKEEQPEEVPLLNLESLTNTVFLMIWGTQGGGKTTLAKVIARMREQAGHSIVVADPHGSKLEWGEWKLIGSGRNYPVLDAYLKQFDRSITSDYELYSTGERQFPYSTLLVDEFTQWADRCKSSASFVKSVCSDLRKIHRCVILITHSDTLTGLGDAKGLREAIDRSAVKLELETEMAANGEYIPTGYGWLQYPKQPKQKVRIPRSIEPALPASTAPTVDLPLDDRQRLEQVYQSQVADHPLEQRQARGELSDRQRSLLEWSSGRGWLSPSKVQSDCWSYRGCKAAEIIRDFQVLRDSGYGEIRQKSGTIQWSRDEKPTPES